jgi:hypothetical protein
MGETIRFKKKALLDKKIEQFCQTTADLLTSIHTRCNSMAEAMTGKKSKRGRKKKSRN